MLDMTDDVPCLSFTGTTCFGRLGMYQWIVGGALEVSKVNALSLQVFSQRINAYKLLKLEEGW